MAKVGTGQVVLAKGQAAPAAARRKARPAAAALTKKGAKAPGKTALGKTAPAKVELGKMASGTKALGKQAPAKMAAASKLPPVSKKASSKASPGQRVAAPGKTPTAKKVRAAPSNAPARKGASPIAASAKTPKLAVNKASRRPAGRIAVPTPAARRGSPAAAPRKAPALRHGGRSQVFTVSHLNEADFKADGLRSYALYRDLGIAAATGGLCQAHVIRMVPPCTEEVRKRHLHQTELQLVYVLKGWMKNEFEGHGEQMMSTGSCWLQPSGIRHTVLDYSPDCEVLEIIVPADFKTEEVG
jgi:uncharacterized RmlC-like cupin family protein